MFINEIDMHYGPYFAFNGILLSTSPHNSILMSASSTLVDIPTTCTRCKNRGIADGGESSPEKEKWKKALIKFDFCREHGKAVPLRDLFQEFCAIFRYQGQVPMSYD